MRRAGKGAPAFLLPELPIITVVSPFLPQSSPRRKPIMSKRIPSAVNQRILASEAPDDIISFSKSKWADTFGTRTESPVSNAYLVLPFAQIGPASASLLSDSSKS